MSVDLPTPGHSDPDSRRNFKALADRFPLQRQDISDDAVGPAQIDGTWTTWSPTWTNLTVGDGTVTAQYLSLGGIVFYKILLEWGSTTSISGSVRVSTPATAVIGTNAALWGGDAVYNDSGTNVFRGIVRFFSTTSLALITQSNGANNPDANTVQATVPHTWAATDEISITGWFQT